MGFWNSSKFTDLQDLEGFSDLESDSGIEEPLPASAESIELAKNLPSNLQDRKKLFAEKYPSIDAPYVEQIYQKNPSKFAENITNYAAMEKVARIKKFRANQKESLENDPNFQAASEEEKKNLLKQAYGAADTEAEKVRTGQKSAESAQDAVNDYLSTELAKAASFQHQNFLLRYVSEFSSHLKANTQPTKKTLVSEGQNTANNPLAPLRKTGNGYEILTMNTEKLSSLVPRVKFYKMVYKSSGATKTEIPFPTTSMGLSTTGKIFHADEGSTDPRTFFQNRDGFGIRSFEWVLQGQNEATKFVDTGAKLSLYFQDFAQFIAERSKDGKKFKYLDLILETKDELLKDNEVNYIVAEVGWSVPPQSGKFTQSELDAIKSNKVSLMLTMIEYNLNFDDSTTASFTLDIEYHSSYEKMMKSRRVNAIGPDKETTRELLKLRKQLQIIKDNQDKIGGEDLSSEIDEKNSEITQLKQTAGRQSRTSIFAWLVKNNRIFKIKVGLKDILTFQGVDPAVASTITSGLKSSQDKKDITAQIISLLEEEDGSTDAIETQEEIYFTSVGSVLDAVISNALDKNKLEAMGYPLYQADSQFLATTNILFSGKEINIYDIPVDTRLLSNFLYKHIVEPNTESVSLSDFISSFLQKVMEGKIEEYATRYNSSNREYKTTFVTSKSKINGRLNNKQVRSSFSEGHENSYIVIYSSPKNGEEMQLPYPADYFKSKKEDQEVNDIYHFNFGSSDSIVKSVNFEKTNLEAERERRIVEGGDPYAILRNVFDVNIDMFGNTMFYPGRMVYVNPSHSMGDGGRPWVKGSIFNTMGLGGYHIITNVSNFITDGSFNSTVKAKFVSSGNKVDGK